MSDPVITAALTRGLINPEAPGHSPMMNIVVKLVEVPPVEERDLQEKHGLTGKLYVLEVKLGVNAQAVMRSFEAMQQQMGQLTQTVVQSLGQQQELRRENEDLQRLKLDGKLNFSLTATAEDFRAFAVIMVLGTRKAAARHLNIPYRTFYDQVNPWARGNKEMQRMFRLIEWRKKIGRRITVPLGPSVQSGEPNDEAENPETVAGVLESIAAADSRDYPEILREILGVLEMQNPKNWAEFGREAISIIREEVGG